MPVHRLGEVVEEVGAEVAVGWLATEEVVAEGVEARGPAGRPRSVEVVAVDVSKGAGKATLGR